MNDPHVEALYFQFVAEDPGEDFGKAGPLTTTLGTFDVKLQDDILTARPQQHYADAESAKADLEPHLRAWESTALLDWPRSRIRFTFLRSQVIDRDPEPGVLVAEGISLLTLQGFEATVTVTRNEYPAPDPSFQVSPLTDTLTERLRVYRDGRAQLPAMAYWVLTALEEEFGDRRRVGRQLNIDYEVLSKLGELTSRNDPTIGRKAKGNPTLLTKSERQWMEEAMIRLIRLVGEYNAGVTLSQITMADFPRI